MLAAAFLMAAALTPSLIPRGAVLQGALCGLSLAIGYAVGNLVTLGWRVLELPALHGRVRRLALLTASLSAALAVAVSLWFSLTWQNAIRLSMGMAPEPSGRLVAVLAIALGVGLFALVLWRVFRMVIRLVERFATRFLSPVLAWSLGVCGASLLFWSLGSGVLLPRVLMVLDKGYAALDALVQTDLSQPQDPAKTGSAASLTPWQSIGHEGRNAVTAWPTAADIREMSKSEAQEPIRVYVGLNSADDPQARADLALAELQRVGAFDRALLVIATPTGTGWLDPAGIAPLEILHRGDVATVAVQYSYLPSWLALFLAPEYGEATARAVFQRIYGHWTRLPKDSRPRLYLFGLSLGALNSSLSADLLDIVGDPFDGALWVGPPFSSQAWQTAISARDAGSPVWRPVFRGGRAIRFANRGTGFLSDGEDPQVWGPLRIGFLMYAGDPITFFDPGSLLHRPGWLVEPRSPDLPPGLRWYPVVSALQGLVDAMTATQVPAGHGHVYLAEDYLRAWLDLTAPDGWTTEAVARVLSALRARNL